MMFYVTGYTSNQPTYTLNYDYTASFLLFRMKVYDESLEYVSI
jgi:hypothetical protein